MQTQRHCPACSEYVFEALLVSFAALQHTLPANLRDNGAVPEFRVHAPHRPFHERVKLQAWP